MSNAPTTHNVNIIRGIRNHAIRKFVQFLKNEAPGHVNPDLTITMEAMSFDELDKLVEKFLGEPHATDPPSN